MAGLSLCRDGVVRDTVLNPCGVPSLQPPPPSADLEAELKTLADQISKNSSPSSLRSELFDRSVKKFCFQAGGDDGRRSSLCPDLKRRIEAVIHKLLRERMAGKEGGSGSGAGVDDDDDDRSMKEGADSSSSSSCSLSATLESLRSKKRKRQLEEMLTWLRDAAVDPGDAVEGAAKEWEKQVLRARQAIYLNLEGRAEMKGFPYRKKRRSGGLPPEISPRRSERIAKKLNMNYLSKMRSRIGRGPTFQADVPEWTGPPHERDISGYKEDLNNSRLLGTQVWLAKDDGENSQAMVGRGRPDSCACSSPGSLACITSHVSEAGLQLRSNLGQAFIDWGFNEMGEEVSKSWENKEQIRFDALEKLNPDAEHSNFWQVVANHFPAKSRRSLVSYYFNVFLLRRVARQSRLTPPQVDSAEEYSTDDDDVQDEKLPDAKRKGKTPERSSSRSSRRSQNVKKKS